MITVLLLLIGSFILVWQAQILYTFQYKQQELLSTQEKNYELINLYKNLGQSIMALNIQLQAAQKLSQINPIQSQESLSQAYKLSSEMMQELRQIVKIMDEERRVKMAEDSGSAALTNQAQGWAIQPLRVGCNTKLYRRL